MSLQAQLDALKSEFVSQLPEDVRETMMATTLELANTGIAEQAPQVGDRLKEFELPNQNGQQRSLSKLLEAGPVVVSFYRGGWCPYCNLELRAFQQILPDINSAGASLVAITPELPDASLSTTEKNELAFEVLSDEDADYARDLGLVFTLPEVLRPIYQNFGIDLEKHNGQGQFDLPLAATFVVDVDGKVSYSFVSADYTQRAEPAEVIQALQVLQSSREVTS